MFKMSVFLEIIGHPYLADLAKRAALPHRPSPHDHAHHPKGRRNEMCQNTTGQNRNICEEQENNVNMNKIEKIRIRIGGEQKRI